MDTSLVPVDTARPTRPSVFRCYGCGEAGHRQSSCPNRNRRGLLTDEVNPDSEPIYDEEIDEQEEELLPDSGQILVVRLTCLAPRAQFQQQNSLFHSRSTINGKVCKFIIDSGSCENVIVADVVTKLSIVDEPHPTPYKLSWLQ